MGLNKYCLGDLLELLENNNSDLQFDASYVRGVNNLKKLMPTKVDISDRDLSKFQIVKPGEFVFNHRTSRNGSKFSIAYNNGTDPIICTEDYVVFRVRPDCTPILMAEWLYMYFNRSEFDRYVITNSWGSSTEFYNWEDICSITLELPGLPTQEKYVAIYKAMQANQQSYERGLEDLKLVCEGYINELRHAAPIKPIREYLIEANIRNDMGLPLDSVRGLATSKEMIPTKADMSGVSLKNYKVVGPRQIAYVPDTSRRGDKVSLGFNDSDNSVLVSTISVVFGTDHNYLLPEYLMLFLTRAEFDRYARFNSWGSARETFTFDDLGEMRIPIPSIDIQQSISQIFAIYKMRNIICERMNSQLNAICPILIRGSLSDGG